MQQMRLIGLLGLTLLVSACGGGGGSSSPPPPPPPPPAPAPPPAATLLSGPISVFASADQDMLVTVSLSLNFTPTTPLYARVTADGGPAFQVRTQPAANGTNRYDLRVAMPDGSFAGLYQGTAHVQLCADQDCGQPETASPVDVAYVIDVLPAGFRWPGDHLTTLAAWPDAPEWATFQGNPAHTGFVPVDIDAAAIAPRWHIMGTGDLLGSSYYAYPQTIAAAAGRFYQSSGARKVLARDESDGHVLWTYDVGNDGVSSLSMNPPGVYGSSVYFASVALESASFYGVDAATGARRFRMPMQSQSIRFLAPVAGPLGVYQEGGEYGGLYAFDPTTGQELFYRDIPASASMWSPAVSDDAVYYFGRDGLKVFDPSTGGLRTTIPLASEDLSGYDVVGAAVIGAPGRVYAAVYGDAFTDGGTHANTLTAFDATAGTIAWQLPGNFPATPAYHDGLLYVPNGSTNAVEVRAEGDGTLQWAWSPPAAADTRLVSEVLLTNNLMFVSTDANTYAVDLSTHQAVWSFPASGRLALSRNGVLYLQNALAIFAFNVK